MMPLPKGQSPALTGADRLHSYAETCEQLQRAHVNRGMEHWAGVGEGGAERLAVWCVGVFFLVFIAIHPVNGALLWPSHATNLHTLHIAGNTLNHSFAVYSEYS